MESRLTANISAKWSLRKPSPNTPSSILMRKEKNVQHILSRQEPHIQVNGFKVSEMDMEFRCGQMALAMKANGRITELMVMGALCM